MFPFPALCVHSPCKLVPLVHGPGFLMCDDSWLRLIFMLVTPVCPVLIRGPRHCICQVEATCRAWVDWPSSGLLCGSCMSLLAIFRYLPALPV